MKEIETYADELDAMTALFENSTYEMQEALKTIKHLESEVEFYKAAYESAMRIVKPQFPEKFADQYFICGEGGQKDKNNLPDRIHICPAYGVDWFQVYEKSETTFAPEW